MTDTCSLCGDCEAELYRLRSELSGAREWATRQAEVIERLKKESQWNGHSAKEWSLALQGLTPQGSEYASDPQACVDYVRKDRASAHESRIKAVEVRRERDALKAQVEKMSSYILAAEADVETYKAERDAAWDTGAGSMQTIAQDEIDRIKSIVARLAEVLELALPEIRSVAWDKVDCVELVGRADAALSEARGLLPKEEGK